MPAARPGYTLSHHGAARPPSNTSTSSPPAPGTPRVCCSTSFAHSGAATRPRLVPASPSPGRSSLAYRACLWSRVASRVLLRMTSFPAASPDDIYEGIQRLAWEDHLDAARYLGRGGDVHLRQGPLAQLNTHFAEQRVKDAVVDRFRARSGRAAGRRPGPAEHTHQSPSDPGGGHRQPGSFRRRPAPTRVPYGGRARRPSRRTWPPPILMRAGWPAIAAEGGPLARPHVRLGDAAHRGSPDGRRRRAGTPARVLRLLGLGRDSTRVLARGSSKRPGSGANRAGRPTGLLRLRRRPPRLGTARGNARRAGLAGRIVFERRDSRLGCPRLDRPTTSRTDRSDGAPTAAPSGPRSGDHQSAVRKAPRRDLRTGRGLRDPGRTVEGVVLRMDGRGLHGEPRTGAASRPARPPD